MIVTGSTSIVSMTDDLNACIWVRSQIIRQSVQICYKIGTERITIN